MANEVFNLAIMLSLTDKASGGLRRFESELKEAEKQGKQFAQTYDKIRKDLNRDLAIGGVGIGSLALMGKGVKVAGDFQASMTDLRSSFAQLQQDGSINLDALGKDMAQAEALALRLGNALPGTTQDFVSLLNILKSGGLDANTIFGGAGEAAALLAVANNAAPEAIGKDFAKFGQIYKLSGEEYKSAANILSQIYTSKGIESGAIIEASKYFQGRAGNALGLTGLKGAEQSVRLLAYLQKQGLDASQSGTSLSTFLVQLAKNKKATDDLRKSYGITLDLFDKGGNFKGIDNAVSQLEKLKKLNPEQLIIALNKLGGEEGSLAGTTLVSGGIAAWKQFNSEVDKSITLQQKTAEKSKDFNNQVEALTGSIENLVVTGFQPMLPSLTSGITSMNEMVGSIQTFAKEHPTALEFLGTIGLYGSTALIAYSGIKTLTGGVRLLSMVNKFSKSDGLLPYLEAIKVETNRAGSSERMQIGFIKTGQQAAIAEQKVSKFRSSLQGIAGSPVFQVGVQVVGIAVAEAAITAFAKMVQEQNERTAQFLETAREINKEYDALMGLNLSYSAPGDYKGQENRFDAQAAKFWKAITEGRTLETALNPDKRTNWEYFALPNPYIKFNEQAGKSESFNPEVAAKYWQQKGVTMPLQDPNMLARVIMQLQSKGGEMGLNLANIEQLLKTLEIVAGKADFDTALKLVAQAKGVVEQPPTQNRSLNSFLPQANTGFSVPYFPGIKPFSVSPDLMPPFLRKNTFSFGQNTFPSAPFPATGGKNFNPNYTPPTDLFAPVQKSSNDLSVSMQSLIEQFKQTGELNLDDVNQKLKDFTIPLPDAKQSIFDLGDTSKKAVKPIGDLSSASSSVALALNAAAIRIRNIEITPPRFDPISIPVPSLYKSPVPQSAGATNTLAASLREPIKTGVDPKLVDEFLRKYGGEIANANYSRGGNSSGSSETPQIVININPTINIHGNDKEAGLIAAKELLKTLEEKVPEIMAKKIKEMDRRT